VFSTRCERNRPTSWACAEEIASASCGDVRVSKIANSKVGATTAKNHAGASCQTEPRLAISNNHVGVRRTSNRASSSHLIHLLIGHLDRLAVTREGRSCH
jgi:hypothetical protein